MNDKIQLLKNHVCALSRDKNFIHHKWFVEQHLEIVEQLVNELCDLYPEADRNVVLAMVWLHDLGKIITSKKLSRDKEDEITLTEGKKLLDELGFTSSFTDKVIHSINRFEKAKSGNMLDEAIEVQIISTADGCSHFVGPFMTLHWYDNAHKPIEELIEDAKFKATKNWQKKIVLPEARKAFQNRYDQIMEQDPDLRNKRFFNV